METVSVMMQAVVKQYALYESQQRAKAEERLLIVKELYAEDMAKRLQVCVLHLCGMFSSKGVEQKRARI